MEQFEIGEKVQFRKVGGWEGLQGEWVDGTFQRESVRCVFIADSTGKVNEYWKHRVEIRKTAGELLRVTADEHGFKTAELNAQAGGRVVITDFGAEYVTDIGSVSSVNTHGLGGNEWIRSVADIERHITDIERTRWLTAAEQQACIEFLRAIAE